MVLRLIKLNVQTFSVGLQVKSVPEIRNSLREIVEDAGEIGATLLKYVEGKSVIDGKTIRVFRC